MLPIEPPRFEVTIPAGRGAAECEVRAASPSPGGEGRGEGDPALIRRKAKEFKFGSISVPYLEYTRSAPKGLKTQDSRLKTYSYHAIFYYLNGRRVRETRATFKKAKARAEEIATLIQNGKLGLIAFSEADKASFLRSNELLLETKTPLELACAKFAALQRRCPAGRTIDEIFDLGLKNLPAVGVAKSSPDLVEEILRDMARDQAGDLWVADIKRHGHSFAKYYNGPIADLRAATVTAWLDSLDCAPRTRNNHRASLGRIIAYAIEKKYLPKNWSELDDVKRSKEKKLSIRIFTPDQGAKLLGHCRPNLVPWMALQFFAGIRTRELQGDADHPALDWKNIKIEKRLIYIPGDVAKEGTPDRIIPMSDNLAAWLMPYARKSGEVCGLANISNALRHTARRAGTPWVHNAARKSYISYRLPLVKNIGEVADAAGNSPAMITKHYRQPIEEEEAKRWFDIYPTTSEVLQLHFGLK